MRGRPVDAVAVGTCDEAILCCEHVRRYAGGDGGFRHGLDHRIAAGAAREWVGKRIESECRDDLAQLLAEMVAVDEEQRHSDCLALQPMVACQDGAALGACVAYQG